MLSNHQEELAKILKWQPQGGKVLKTCLSGSYAYGLNNEESDLDVRGIFMWPQKEYLLIGNPNDELVPVEFEDTKFFELKKFLHLCSKGNPHQLELLFSPSLYVSDDFCLVERFKGELLGKQGIHDAYGGFAHSEWKQVQKQQDVHKRNKMAKHVFRLLHQAKQFLTTGTISVELDPEFAEFIKAITAGEYNLYEMNGMYKLAATEHSVAFKNSKLPLRPDKDFVNWLLYETRKGYCE